ncbi:8-amino-7-oxononanoate synthase [Pedobacter sp. Leaf176]|uniref:aminotransferase class I/II-fold pyridoxal phosphate-dependent enzyme n=1 Tax=Pedobacter sp. Leaf176 TaxID=1736286 RepID=UPI0007004A5A|nr:8-amino-7-oxononanoate synthase [Pedobacter sp. Leaf176]KQR71033.1 8-amino-7-oxononanoate synthase [Pedobacter sp. Leaf176]
MNKIERCIANKLDLRKSDLSIRKLSTYFPPIDFCSNDYLGFAHSVALKNLVEEQLGQINNYKNGSGGSRLLSGNTIYIEETEQYIADFHRAESGLIFNSGYDANVGLLSSIPQRGDTIIADELIHASLIDGSRLSYATRYKFLHNNIIDLEEKIKVARGNVFVVVESVYSMDGDFAPLKEISMICEKYSAALIVDEAHAAGIFGVQGKGLVSQLYLENKVFARIVTFGKAMGAHGAIVLGSENLRSYLINFARSFIYTTAMPIHNIISVKCAYILLHKVNPSTILDKIELFRNLVKQHAITAMESQSTIQGVIFSSNAATKLAASKLQSKGFDVRAILSPTVPAGKERLRICLHSYNTDEQIKSLIEHLKDIQNNG